MNNDINRDFAKLDLSSNILHPNREIKIVVKRSDSQGVIPTIYDEYMIFDPTPEQYLSAVDGPWYPYVDQKPEFEEGYEFIGTDKGRFEDDTIYRIYEKNEIVPALSDYDGAMERYLVKVRYARGYTTREPDSYLTSEEPRWKQDAIDWVKFRDNVMRYGLAILNHAQQTGEIPSIFEFLDDMPTIEWTWHDDQDDLTNDEENENNDQNEEFNEELITNDDSLGNDEHENNEQNEEVVTNDDFSNNELSSTEDIQPMSSAKSTRSRKKK